MTGRRPPVCGILCIKEYNAGAVFELEAAGMLKIGSLAGMVAVLWAATALSEPSDLAAGISPPSRPARPFARGGPRNAYIEWRANPEYDLRGYHVYRQEVADTETATPVGDPVRVNGNNPVSKTEFVDTGIEKDRLYCYVIEAVGAGDAVSERSEPSMPPVHGQRLRVYFPDIYANQGGIYRFQSPADGSPRIAIPIATQCAYDISTYGIQVAVHLPRNLIDSADSIAVYPSGLMGGFLFARNASVLDNEIIELRIIAAGLSSLPLYGAGTLFYVVITPSEALLAGETACGPLSFIRDQPLLQGVRLYDGALKPITLDLDDGLLCSDGLCAAHGDANLDGRITEDDAEYILQIAAGGVPEPDPCTWQVADINLDNSVDQADAVLLLRRLHVRDLWPDPISKSSESAWDSFAAPEKSEGEQPLVRIGNVEAETGSEIAVPVYIENAPQAAGCSFDVTFPAGALGLSLQSVELGEELAEAGFKLAWTGSRTVSERNKGFVHVAIAGGGAIASKEPVTAAYVRFMAPKSGGGGMSVPLRASDAALTDPYGFTPRYDAPNAPSSVNGSIQVKGLVDGSMAILVVDSATSAPIGNAQVFASPGPASPVTQNNAGVYIFASLEPGEHEFTAQAPGYVTLKQKGLVPSGSVGTMTMALVKGSGPGGGCAGGGAIAPIPSSGMRGGAADAAILLLLAMALASRRLKLA